MTPYYWSMLEIYITFSEEEKNQYINQNSEMAEYILNCEIHSEKFQELKSILLGLK